MARATLLQLSMVSAFTLTLACTYGGAVRSAEWQTDSDHAVEQGWLAVHGVPVVLQDGTSDCGVAALTAVLKYWGCNTRELRDLRQYREGALAGDLRDAARASGLAAFLFSGTVRDLVEQVESGRPVIVGLVKEHGDEGLAHYEVVIGFNRRHRQVLTMDPARGLRRNSFEGFISEWQRSEWLTLVAFPPPA